MTNSPKITTIASIFWAELGAGNGGDYVVRNVPEGLSEIARQFIAGIDRPHTQVSPEGTEPLGYL